MSLIKNNALVGASGAAGYTLQRSLRFRSSASAYLSRTPASAGNRTTWTWSGWVKRGSLGAQRNLFTAYIGSGSTDTSYFTITYNGADKLALTGYSTIYRLSTAVYRDPSAWYHVVVAVDTTQSTAANRFRIYVNGTEVTAFDTSNNPAQNTNLGVNQASPHYFAWDAFTTYYDGYLTEINFIDGQALGPTYFGETDATTGVWKPISYSGTYGTNGFYLNFSDNSTTTTLGYDYSGNSNNWTANNISVTSGATYDSMTDVPTLTSTDAANYATLNPIGKYSAAVINNGNLQFDTSGYGFADATIIPTSGKWYAEFQVSGTITTSGWAFGVIAGNVARPLTLRPGTGGAAGYWYCYSGSSSHPNAAWFNETTQSSSLPLPNPSKTQYRICIDVDNGYLWFGDDTYWYNSTGGTDGNPATGANPTFTVSSLSSRNGLTFACGTYGSGSSWFANFGQRPFAYTPPAGFKSLNTYNLPDSTIEDGGQYFNTVTYTGNGTDPQSISGLNFQPDFVWVKSRSGGQSHVLTDAVRGATKTLYSDTTLAETTSSLLTAFNSDGFDVEGGLNVSARTLVGWSWKANGSGVSNTDGSITSTVSANTTAGFSIVTYTGNGTAGATVGHGLGVAPDMIIVKNRDGVYHWAVQHTSLGATKYLTLSTTDDETTSSAPWNNTAPTSSVFSLGGSSLTNRSANDMVAYCFADVEGYSKFGSYTGNGSATGDGPFVYTGFRPAFVMVKQTSTSGASWTIHDSTRNTYNLTNNVLYPNLANAETSPSTQIVMDLLSNGFKLKGNAANVNASGSTYIYMALAENPFKNSLAR